MIDGVDLAATRRDDAPMGLHDLGTGGRCRGSLLGHGVPPSGLGQSE